MKEEQKENESNCCRILIIVIGILMGYLCINSIRTYNKMKTDDI